MKETSYDILTKKYHKEMLKTLGEFIAIDSTYDEKTIDEENPFGQGVTKALCYIADVARNDGFEVTNYGNKVVEILVGSGEKNITIMAHADVVPAASGWTFDPFTLTRKKDVLFGRGVADDKGPLLASYYALKALKDKNLLGNYQVRFLVGGNEERGSLGMYHYFHELNKPVPTLGFSPDSDFPLIFAEKGIINFDIHRCCSIPGLVSIHGGLASNSVIEKCEVTMEISNSFINFILDNFAKDQYEIHTVNDLTTVTFFGKAAHGASPELGVNAGYIALKALADYSKNEEFVLLSKKLAKLDGSGYNCGGASPDMGHNSSNLGIINYENGEFHATVNFRYVNTCKREELLTHIKEAFAPFETEVLGEAELLYFSKDSVLISTLLKAYQDETGDLKSEPLAIGGGTYAKETSNVVAFGMEFPGWDSNMHSPGESTRISDLYKAMSIYARAIIDLGNKL